MLRDHLLIIQANIPEMIYEVVLNIWIKDTLLNFERLSLENNYLIPAQNPNGKILFAWHFPSLGFYHIEVFIYL